MSPFVQPPSVRRGEGSRRPGPCDPVYGGAAPWAKGARLGRFDSAMRTHRALSRAPEKNAGVLSLMSWVANPLEEM